MISAYSLENPFRMDSGLSLVDFLDQQVCSYCDCKSLDFKNFVDVKACLDEVIYHVHELVFDCGHLNLVFVLLNDASVKKGRCLDKAEFGAFIKGSSSVLRDCWHSTVLSFYQALSSQNIELARQLSKELRRDFPKDPFSYILSAKVALKEFDFEGYEDYFQKASQLEPVLHQIELSDQVLDEKVFELGKVFVTQDIKQRRLFINQQNQGGLLLDPSLAKGDNLSTVPESFCSVIFYPAAQRFPQGNLLMLGLGSGAGVICLLNEFKDLTITVVEKFQTVIDLAVKHFHYLEEFVNEGRLRVVCDEGIAYIVDQSQSALEPSFDAVCIDMYSGEEGVSFSLEPDQLSSMNCLGRSIFMNYIGKASSNDFNNLLNTFLASNITFKYISSVFEDFQNMRSASNLLLSTIDFSQDLSLKSAPSNLASDINEQLSHLASNKQDLIL